METEIQKYYRDKSVLLTGGSGFLGKVFLEKILRTTEVKRLYLLIRSKKGQDARERVDDLLKDPLYEKLLSMKPHIKERITPIVGDCALPQLGINPQERAELIDNVDIVIHSAATVRFNEPLSQAIAINVRATLDLVRMAKDMRNLKAFVHVSSAFANCNLPHVEEEFYVRKLTVDSEGVCRLVDLLGSNMVNHLSDKICQEYPNTYCFSKALAEEAILTHANDLPVCIFRPGIVAPTYDDPVSGWIDNLNGPTALIYGVCYGVLRVMYLRLTSSTYFVPVDYCANAMLACAWDTAQTVRQITHTPPPIYNLVPNEPNSITWEMYKKSAEKHGPDMPITRMLWLPFLVATSSKQLYNLLWFIYHTIPAYIIDFALLCMGKKPKMMKTYRKIRKQVEMIWYFVENEWTFGVDNMQKLCKSLSKEDQHLYKFDMLKIDWNDYLLESLRGMRIYLMKELPSTIPQGKRLYNKLLFLHRTLQIVVYGGGAAILYWLL